MSLRKKLAKGLLKCFGWNAVALTPDFPKCVLVVAPHTSNWDFFVGKLAYEALGREGHFLIKKDWFFFPLNFFFKAVGGIPVDRKSKENALRKTENIIHLFQEREHFCLGITPEGTRKPTAKWKRGFWHIAKAAHVPIVLVKLDYGNKCVSLGKVIYPGNDEAADMLAVKEYYRGVRGKRPKNFIIE